MNSFELRFLQNETNQEKKLGVDSTSHSFMLTSLVSQQGIYGRCNHNVLTFQLLRHLITLHRDGFQALNTNTSTTTSNCLGFKKCIYFLISSLKVRCGFSIGSLFGFLGRSSLESGSGTTLSCGSLFAKSLFLDGNGFEFVNLFEQDSLVLEFVTLGEHVQGVVNVLIDLLGISQLLEHAAKDSLAAHPQDLERKTGVGSTSALTSTFNTIERKIR